MPDYSGFKLRSLVGFMGIRSFRLLLLCVILVIAVGCSRQVNKEEPWVTIGDSPVQIGELMIYLLQTYSEFESHGGEDVWLIQDFNGGKPAGEVAKEGAMENLIKVKVLVGRANEIDMVVEEETVKSFEVEASAYFKGLPSSFVETYNISEAMVQQVFIENYLADEVISTTMANYDADNEIEAYLRANQAYVRLLTLDPEDILTTYQIHHMVVRTHVRDDDGQWQPMSEDDQLLAKEKMNGLYVRLEEGEEFLKLILEETDANYLETTPEGLSLTKDQLPDNYLSAIDAVGIGGFTEIIKGDYGYHVIQLLGSVTPTQSEIDSYNERFSVWVEALKAEAVIDLTKEAFGLIYERWRSSETIVYGQEWDSLDFLEIYKTLK